MRINFVRGLVHAWVGAATFVGGALCAVEPKVPTSSLDLAEFSAPELYLSSANVPLADLLGELPNRGRWQEYLAERGDGGAGIQTYIDPRSGTATNVMGLFPLLPGDGLGNRITLAGLGRQLGRELTAVDEAAVAEATRRFLVAHAPLLGIDPGELGPVTAAKVDERLWQATAPQRVSGVEVRYARIVASIVHGNVVTFGTEAWGAVRLATAPSIRSEDALEAGFAAAGGRSAADLLLREPRLEIVPVAPPEYQAGGGYAGPVGAGYRHRLVWSFAFERAPEIANWEVLVDAHSGEVLALQDIHSYVQRRITGAIYPETSTEICPGPSVPPGQCGTMQSGWPMPYVDTGFSTPNNYTNSAGVYDWTSGTATTTLTGKYFDIHDSCGVVLARSGTGDIDLGGSNGDHECDAPGINGAGNTAAGRSGYHELNRIAEQARGWLSNNTWLQSTVPVNMNVSLTCNALWDVTNQSINFYRSGNGCRNAGELAGIFDHEWGHGLDDNDTGGSLSNSSEGYADLAMMYRLQTSCIGFGFFQPAGGVCGFTLDGTGRNANEALTGPAHCDTDCSGVRDADWAKHLPSTADTPVNFVCLSCTVGAGPCGRQPHCAAAPVRQAGWDLVARDLTAAPFNLDSQSAFVVGAKVFLQGSGSIASWYACTCPTSSDGCGATNGYPQWLAADDDNGTLTDGTPHMTAIHAAFNRHGIACVAPTPINSGCSGGPTTAPILAVSPGSFQNQLAWTAVPGASRYWVLRTEGQRGCDFGKTRIADITGTTYTDTAVDTGRTYYYNVVAQGTSTACYTRLSSCVASGLPFLDGFETGSTLRWSAVAP